ncbi:MAG: 5-(carboxyamino)imidazole ribonucleotide synthase [Myxococcales bacterium]|nr:5-(carboxyamino)imidazole ribonucleotide synthase [Myxococcales bacterium]
MTRVRRIPPGKTIGILGGGQLGRMLAISARQLGYRIGVFTSEVNSPGAQLADEVIVAPYEDLSAVHRFAQRVDVVTFEFENVPASAAKIAQERVPVWPDPTLLFVAQNRIREKSEVQRAGFLVTPFAPIRSVADLEPALKRVGPKAVLKTATAGYDGRGQGIVSSLEAAEEMYAELGYGECILEAFVPFERELSVVVARGQTGELVDYGVFENAHVDHVLDCSVSPPRIEPRVEEQARLLARTVAERLELVGVLCVELFLSPSGEVLFNELAPRPHNSGHLTIEAYSASQFEQQLRAVCGQALGSVHRRAPAAAMVNLMGELWTYDLDGAIVREPDWQSMLKHRACHLHLYGKRTPRLGRKMGHITTLAETPELALQKALAARSALLAAA